MTPEKAKDLEAVFQEVAFGTEGNYIHLQLSPEGEFLKGKVVHKEGALRYQPDRSELVEPIRYVELRQAWFEGLRDFLNRFLPESKS